MKRPSALAVPLVITFAFLSAANAAEERPNTTLVQKAKTSAVASSTASKAIKAPAATSVSNTVKTGAKQAAPTAGQAAPAPEHAYEGCQGKGSDA